MKDTVIVAIFLITAFTLYRLEEYIRLLFGTNKKFYILIKLEKYREFNLTYFIQAIISLVIGYIFHRLRNDDFDFSLFWSVLALSNLILAFITPSNYILISSRGIKTNPNRKWISWDKVEAIEWNNNNETELILRTQKRQGTIVFGTAKILQEIKDKIREIRPDVWDKFPQPNN